MPLRPLPQQLQERHIRRDAPVATEASALRSRRPTRPHGRRLAPTSAQGIVVRRHHRRDRHVERIIRRRERQQPAVIATQRTLERLPDTIITRAVCTANMLASVPELKNRNFSNDGNRALNNPANSPSSAVCPPRFHPNPSCVSIARFIDGWLSPYKSAVASARKSTTRCPSSSQS